MTFVEGFMVACAIFGVMAWLTRDQRKRCSHNTDEFDERITAQQIQIQILAHHVGCDLPTEEELRRKIVSMRYGCGVTGAAQGYRPCQGDTQEDEGSPPDGQEPKAGHDAADDDAD